MFGFIKRFFSKPAAPEPPAVAAEARLPAVSTLPPQGAPASPAAPPAAGTDDRRTAPAAEAAAASPEGVIALPLAPILAALPPNLAALAASAKGGTFSLPIKTALAQLASGAVRISFGELRQGSPPGAFYDDATEDRSPVSLPLPQILASLDTALLARRRGQKLVAVPESVTSVFGQGRNLQAPVAGAPEPERPPAIVSPSKTAEPAQAASPFTRRPVPAALPSLAPKGSGPDRTGMPFPAPKPPARPSPVPPVAEKEFVAVALSAVSESWPPPILQSIAELQLQSATVLLPVNRLEAGLKEGRVVFTWGELCHWLQPAPTGDSPANREVALELPLKVVAPLFLARRRPWAAPRKLTGAANVPDQIPALFGRAAGTLEAAAFAPAAAGPGSVLGEIFGLPGRTEWTPPEICRRICGLEGVAGSVLALSDGLVLAAQLPSDLKAETVAAFLPQIFGRVSQSAVEMQLGPLTSVALAAGQGRCAIYKAGKLYLAVLGHAGAALPEAVLGRIAAELAKRNP